MGLLRHLVAMIQHTPFLQRDPLRISKTRIPEKIQAGSGEREQYLVDIHSNTTHKSHPVSWTGLIPLHPLLVPAVSEYRFWGNMDHQGHRGIGLSLVPGQKKEQSFLQKEIKARIYMKGDRLCSHELEYSVLSWVPPLRHGLLTW